MHLSWLNTIFLKLIAVHLPDPAKCVFIKNLTESLLDLGIYNDTACISVRNHNTTSIHLHYNENTSKQIYSTLGGNKPIPKKECPSVESSGCGEWMLPQEHLHEITIIQVIQEAVVRNERTKSWCAIGHVMITALMESCAINTMVWLTVSSGKKPGHNLQIAYPRHGSLGSNR